MRYRWHHHEVQWHHHEVQVAPSCGTGGTIMGYRWHHHEVHTTISFPCTYHGTVHSGVLSIVTDIDCEAVEGVGLIVQCLGQHQVSCLTLHTEWSCVSTHTVNIS